ncbi:helix-turn-helix domain-containing protein [Gorillibacterium sp. CAU 1737]|uniref:helix-turn-helix domain-containing protein n=1 Tax=Gorillibacterium sp. CAU 1737 TaxID=3140362 RepID=UPI0032616227
MKTKPHLEAALETIEQQLAQELTAGQVAERSHVSPMQLYRDFYQMTGHSVKEYIRKRRLSKALSLVKHSALSLSAIAYECGYSSQQAFCRSVKAVTGLSPLAYKDSSNEFYFPRFNQQSQRQITLSTETLPLTLRLVYSHPEPKGIEARAIARLFRLLPAYNGRIFGRNRPQGKDRGASYELYIEGSEDLVGLLAEGGFANLAFLPERTAVFAKTTARHREEEVNAAWDDLYTRWLGSSMFKQADSPYWEEFLYRSGKVHKLVLYLPVVKREDFPRLRLEVWPEQRFVAAHGRGMEAEEEASEKLCSFLQRRYPLVLPNARRFCMVHKAGDCICGVETNDLLMLPEEDRDLLFLVMPAGRYAVLDGACSADSEVYEGLLLSWVDEIGIRCEEDSLFVVHEAMSGFDPDNIRTKLFLPLKDDRNG